MVEVSLAAQVLLAVSTVFVTYQLYRATGRSKKLIAVLVIWSIITAVLGLTGFYRHTQSIPPRFLFLVGPGMATTIILLMLSRGRKFLESVNISDLTLMQAVRFPVELVLYLLFAASLVPEIMTFEGSNFDIITGLTSPFIFYLVLKRQMLGLKWLLMWNYMGMLFLFGIMGIAILSLSTPFQQFAFDQPNVGVTYFPFVWLPGIIVPAALFGHIASLWQLHRCPEKIRARLPKKTKLKATG